MTNEELIGFIEDKRKGYKPHYEPEMKKGARFHSNLSVASSLKFKYFGPYSKELAEDVPMDFIENNIDEVFNDLCYEDWHFTNKEKWM